MFLAPKLKMWSTHIVPEIYPLRHHFSTLHNLNWSKHMFTNYKIGETCYVIYLYMKVLSFPWSLPTAILGYSSSWQWCKHANAACTHFNTLFVFVCTCTGVSEFTWCAQISTAFWKSRSNVTVRWKRNSIVVFQWGQSYHFCSPLQFEGAFVHHKYT